MIKDIDGTGFDLKKEVFIGFLGNTNNLFFTSLRLRFWLNAAFATKIMQKIKILTFSAILERVCV